MTATGFERAVEAMRGAALQVEEDLCINLRGRGLLCKRCEKACPANALTLSREDVDLAGSDCTGCGACVPACPTGVFRLPVFDPERFLAVVGGETEVHLHCSESRDGGGGIVIPCHLLLDRQLIAAAAAEGVTRIHLHGERNCHSCHRGDARRHLDKLYRGLARWFGDRAPRILAGDAAPDAKADRAIRQDDINTNRRGFLRIAGLRAAAGAAWLVPIAQESEDENAESFAYLHAEDMPRRPEAWRMALTRRKEKLPWKTARGLPWYSRRLGQGCNGCMVCAERCPTGALEGVADGQVRRISFDPQLCTNCTLCQRLCPQDVIQARPVRSLDEAGAPRADIMVMTVRPCTRCGTAVPSTEIRNSLCPVCANEQEMDEEWLEMLEG